MPLANSIASPIKSIQRGSITMSSVSSNTATITAVNTAKSVVHFLGQWTSNASNIDALARIVLTNGTTVTVDKATSTGQTTVSYEVIEYN